MVDRLSQSQAIEMFNRLQAIKAALREKTAELNPMTYGMPDLLFPHRFDQGVLKNGDVIREEAFPDESEEDWRDRQDAALAKCIKDWLRVSRDGNVEEPLLIPEMMELIADLFFRRVNKAILWANRGGGKSLLAAILIWLLLVYRKKSIVNMAATGEQSKRVYEYTVQFWDCVPGLKKGMLEEDPFIRLTKLKGNTKLICCSGEQAVGEHLPTFVADEACTDKAQAEINIRRAMQGAFDHEDYIVLLLSTFHHPVGLFQETWDNAEQLGYKQYKWSIYDIMSPCQEGMETATPEDPWAQKSFCLAKCPLSRLEEKRDDLGKVTGQEWVGCLGRARTSHGWQSYRQTLAKFESNKGTRIYVVEHEAVRPRFEGLIYAPTMIDACVVDGFHLDTSARKIVGIDWGLAQCFMVLLGQWFEVCPDKSIRRGLGVVATRIMSNKLTDEVIAQIRAWQEWFGDEVVIRADQSHPYSNKELRLKKYSVKSVQGDRKKIGEDNVQRWLASGIFKIPREHGTLITQLKAVRQDGEGKQVKENRDDEKGDHGPDALKFALMAWDYTQWLKKYGGQLVPAEAFQELDHDED